MNFQATTRQANGVTVVEVAGRLTLSEGESLHEFLHGLLRQGKNRIVLNLAKVTAMDSSGVGELVASYVTIKSCGGELKVVQLAPKVEEILRITKMSFLLEDFSDESAAIRSLLDSPQQPPKGR